MQTETDAVLKYINEVANNISLDKWNVIFASPRNNEDTLIQMPQGFEDISPGIRKNVSNTKKGIILSHNSLTAENMREIDLHENEERKYPSLIIYLLDCRAKDKKDIAMFKNGVVAYGICFPLKSNGKTKSASYLSSQYNLDEKSIRFIF